MISKRHALGRILAAIPFGAARTARIARRGNYLTVLCYHRILDLAPDFPFDEDLVSASPSQFEEEIRFIERRFRVINFRMLKERLAGDGKLPERSLIITFDDGYVDNYEQAFPILARHGLTAVMFVTAGFMGARKLFWWDRLAMIAKRARTRRIAIEDPIRLEIDLDAFPDAQSAARRLVHTAKTLPEDVKESLIRRLAADLGVEIDESRFATTMSWEQLREMSAAGIEIGAHSVSHPIFSNVDAGRLADEVSRSKEIIERELGSEVVAFGAPGRGRIPAEEKTRFERALRELVGSAGYSFSTMYQWGLVYERSFDPFAIRRVGIERYDTPPLFRAKLAFPELVPY